MPKICYKKKKFSDPQLDVIFKANEIMEDYASKGFDLTLRQLYYQFITRNFIANTIKEYNRLGDIISDARMAGLLDWHYLVDRTRNVIGKQYWDKPSHILSQTIESYSINKWTKQRNYTEVWVEKNALIGIVSPVCRELDVKCFACVGYTSMSEMWEAGQRLLSQIQDGKEVHIIHLGDHDPSGIDMSGDIKRRLSTFTYNNVHVLRVALNMSQVEKYNPPPNPAKTTDSRYKAYQEQFGEESWELDALSPEIIEDIIRRAVLSYRDEGLWKEALQTEGRGRKTLAAIVEHFPEVVQLLRGKQKPITVLCADCGATTDAPYCQCLGRRLDQNKELM